ncbi:MAG TPA: hypothetical protein VEY70_23035 [Metabacillus sp.]|nr:hypothetical protein [Metabacillus sp.]
MAKSSIKGITIQLDGETKGLDKALSGVNKRSRDLQGELRDVERLLKFNPGNVVALEQKQKLLTDQVENTTNKLEQLKSAQAEVKRQYTSGEIDDGQYRAFRREIEFTEGSLRDLKKSVETIDDGKGITNLKNDLGKVKIKADEAKDAIKNIGSGLGTAGGLGAAAAGGLVTGMQEYNQDLARLKTNASTAGRDLGLVEDAFMKITEVTGETDSAVETVSNLLASGFNDNQLAQVIDQVNGAAIKFSDTLKTEGIADGIQETFATGAAIGPFAELLERSGIDLDDFNAKLADAKEQGDGANFILQTLAEQGFGEISNKYKEMNPEVQKNAEANAALQKTLADLAIVLTPLIASVTEILTKVIEWATKNPELTATIAAIVLGIGSLVGIFMVLAPIFTTLTALSAALGIGMLPLIGIIAGIVVAIGLLVAAGIYLYKNWDEVKAKAIEIWNSLGEWFSNFFSTLLDLFNSALDWIDEKTNGKFSAVTDAIRKYMDMALKNIQDVWTWIQNTFQNAIDFIVALVTGDFEGMKNAIQNQMENTEELIKNIWSNVEEFFSGIDLKEVGKQILQGLIDGIESLAGSLWSKAQEIAEGVRDEFIGLFDIHSPSRLMKWMGEMVGEGFVIGIDSMVDDIQRASNNMAEVAVPSTPKISSNNKDNSFTNKKSGGLNEIQSEPNYTLIIEPAPIIIGGKEVAKVTFKHTAKLQKENEIRIERSEGRWT